MRIEKPIPCLQTVRLWLHPLHPEDAETLYRINQGEDVLRYFPNHTPPPLDRVRRFIANQQAHWEKYGYGNWGIVPEGESEIIGWGGLQFLPELNETEVGFLLGRPFWGRGYATEVAHASLKFGFEHCQLDHIIALVHSENLASRRVIQKCGFCSIDTITLWDTQLMRYSIKTQQFKNSLLDTESSS